MGRSTPLAVSQIPDYQLLYAWSPGNIESVIMVI
jgi:hypothetical protein